ncbi:hypothetical protein LTR09_010824 [Extremus antarcticus]|uniref:Uncharacterized protein n=1 Tax=Extremus antarcticus TaxID=702011 RepID=A0AAJ0DDL7_9PEZI|nr:hypothetical protein LTR09_010824 [Extremus antarcticus]
MHQCDGTLRGYEESRRNIFKIRRAHKKDLGKIKDCQLMFTLNLKELLIPMLRDDIVDKVEYERLLANPGGSDWAVGHVDSALEERLSECHASYIEILQEMQETMAALCDACRVNDGQFQRHMKQQQKLPAVSGPTKQA